MKCPNCGGEIGRFELAPDCKHCGVNIFYCQQEKLLSQDAKQCELEFASFRILKAKAKCAFIGGPLQILRIVAMLAAIGVIFIPFATLRAELTMFTSKITLSAFGVYQVVSGGELNALLSLKDYMPELFTAFVADAALFMLAFLMGLGIFVALVLTFINITKSAKACCALSAAGFALSIASGIVSLIMPKAAIGTFITASGGAGAFALAGVFALIFVLNLILVRKNVQPDIDPIDLERVKIRKKIKAGELTYDDLPLPVFETEKEKEGEKLG